MKTPQPPVLLHFDAKSYPPWLAIHLESALKVLDGYPVTKRQKKDIGYLMSRYGRLLDDAGLLHYGNTKEEAAAKAVGLAG